MNKSLWLLVAVVVIAVGAYFIFNNPKPANGETIKIGAALGLTGFCANWGEGEQKAIQLAVDEANKNGGINGKTIALVVEDTACDPKTTVNAAQKLVSVDEVAAIIGPTWGDSFEGAYGFLNDSKIVSISPSAAFESLFYNKQSVDYAFSTWFPESADINVVENWAQKAGKNTAVTVHDEDTFGLMMADLFAKEAPAHQLQVLKDYKLPIGYNDFRTIILAIKTLNPQVVFTSFQGPQTKAQFMKQAHELGLQTQFLSSTDIQDPSLVKDFGPVLEGIIYGYADYGGNYDAFAAKYKAAYNTEPEGPSAASAYDAARVFIAALTAHEKNGTDIKTAVQNIDIPGTVAKEIKFDSNHQLTGTTFLTKTIKNGQFVVVQ